MKSKAGRTWALRQTMSPRYERAEAMDGSGGSAVVLLSGAHDVRSRRPLVEVHQTCRTAVSVRPRKLLICRRRLKSKPLRVVDESGVTIGGEGDRAPTAAKSIDVTRTASAAELLASLGRQRLDDRDIWH